VFESRRYRYTILLMSFVAGMLGSHVVLAGKTHKLPSGEVIVDPTTPAGWGAKARKTSKARQTKFKLNYVVQTANHKRAMINGQKVVEGDFISGAKVVKIKQNEVLLRVDGRSRTLRLNKVSGIRKN